MRNKLRSLPLLCDFTLSSRAWPAQCK